MRLRIARRRSRAIARRSATLWTVGGARTRETSPPRHRPQPAGRPPSEAEATPCAAARDSRTPSVRTGTALATCAETRRFSTTPFAPTAAARPSRPVRCRDERAPGDSARARHGLSARQGPPRRPRRRGPRGGDGVGVPQGCDSRPFQRAGHRAGLQVLRHHQHPRERPSQHPGAPRRAQRPRRGPARGLFPHHRARVHHPAEAAQRGHRRRLASLRPHQRPQALHPGGQAPPRLLRAYIFPVLFVLVCDILDTIGRLVFERIRAKAERDDDDELIEKLPEGFTCDDVREEAKVTCGTGFERSRRSRELVPRVYASWPSFDVTTSCRRALR